MNDTYKTIDEPANGYITEKKSKFISHIFPVKTVEDAKTIIDDLRKKYYDARHVCWAYMLGCEYTEFRSNDDGEPSGTAGRPILGQINSNELTDVLIIVVRYFGGTLLGTSGLIKAYKEAAADAIANAIVVTKTIEECITVRFDYVLLNEVMRILKQFDAVHWQQDFNEDCLMHIYIPKSMSKRLSETLSNIYGVTVTK